MTTKYEGQKVVEEAVRAAGLPAVILNPASIMGPGDHDPATPHNQLYRSICCGRLFGSFSGGLAVVDVRDLTAIILKSLSRGRVGEKYLVVGANLRYPDVIKRISRACGRRALPFPIPAPLGHGGGRRARAGEPADQKAASPDGRLRTPERLAGLLLER